jgi:hypothetical protein
VAWRALVLRKADELQHRIEREAAAREASEHSLVCPKVDCFSCPKFWATIKGVLTGVELDDAHRHAHASAKSELGLSTE